MCHSENRYGDKQNKNLGPYKTVDTQKNKLATNRDKPLGLANCANNQFLWFMSNH